MDELRRSLALGLIQLDGGTQHREQLKPERITEYADNIAKVPPALVFFDGEKYWLVDGFYRYHAHKEAGHTMMPCIVREGSQRAAQLASVHLNDKHGEPRSPETKRRMVLMLLEDPEWSQWSTQEIADQCNIKDEKYVAQLRQELKAKKKPEEYQTQLAASIPQADSGEARSEIRKYRTRHGTEATMNVANIGPKVTTETCPLCHGKGTIPIRSDSAEAKAGTGKNTTKPRKTRQRASQKETAA